MSQDQRRALVDALRPAQEAAFAPGEYVEQESFVRASELRTLAQRAGISPGVSVLDVCCGIAGPGRFLTRELACSYLGIDSSESAVALARARSGSLPCRFVVGEVPPLPQGSFDVVLLLETMLVFRDKESLMEEVARVLPAGGQFVFTLEEGLPLSESERLRMPAADTVWLTPLEDVHAALARTELELRWEEDWSEPHRVIAEALADAYAADETSIAERIGREKSEELVAAHRLWSEWLTVGRVRKFAVVAERAQT